MPEMTFILNEKPLLSGFSCSWGPERKAGLFLNLSVQAFAYLVKFFQGEAVQLEVLEFQLFDIETVEPGIVQEVFAKHDILFEYDLREKIVKINCLFLDCKDSLVEQFAADLSFDKFLGKELFGHFLL